MALAAVSAGCGSDAVDANLSEVRLTDDPRVLDLAIDTCNAELDVTVSEDADRVMIEVRDLNPDSLGGSDCLDEVTIELDEPLGDRTIVRADGAPIRPFPYPTPNPVSEDTEVGAIGFCGFEAREPQPGPDWSDAEIGQHYENLDLAYSVAQQFRSDPNWRGMSYRGDGDQTLFVFRFASITSELEATVGEAMGAVPFALEPPDYTDDQLDAARSRLEDRLARADDDSIVGVGGGPTTDVPGRVAVYMVDPANGADLADRIALEPPYGPYCIWPNPTAEPPSDN